VRPFVSPGPDVIEQVRERLRLGSEQVVLASAGSPVKRACRSTASHGTASAERHGPQLPYADRRDGPERQSLIRLSGQLGISDAVIFAGHQSDVRPFYALATLLALPSHSEGSPNVALEAMAAGVPVVATAVGGLWRFSRMDEQD